MLLDEGKLEIEAPDPMDAEKASGHAAIEGHGNICRILVANNADPNSPMIDPPILTLIITEYYANKGQTEGIPEVFDLLVELGAHVNAENLEGVPVLIHAINEHQNNVFAHRLLDRQDTDVKAVDPNNNGSLDNAAVRGHRALVELLAEKEADVKQVNTLGETPLCSAVPNYEIIRVLLETGAGILGGRL
ncbi:hypothetical protein H634G_03285 [Metarhizium anisopliae BRIP 53293]|uniref:Uncharacterized protein n=1 Tax=Metarhizium anisopliae BRIP 53293 TaxID=1291518 RepID=A0A0D9P5A6_METAN|nr:hypothetical protein H634G_03285 [Metarhizium anisopliae BRIP 53293]KJK85055.1 hypothetical protein H633G_11114 [Metarhizium anisopliae BRIP 53284]